MGFTGAASVAPLGFDAALFQPDKKSRNETRRALGLTDPVIAYFGRMIPGKGIQLLAAALGRLKHKRWHFLIDDFGHNAATMGWLDRAIGTVAPRVALRRVVARQNLAALTRGYDGAAKGRRTDGWRAAGTSADSEIALAGSLLRDRMRDLVRNNPHAAKAVSVLVNNIVGGGIMPRAASGDDKLDASKITVARADGPAIAGIAKGTIKGSPCGSGSEPAGGGKIIRSAIKNNTTPPAT